MPHTAVEIPVVTTLCPEGLPRHSLDSNPSRMGDLRAERHTVDADPAVEPGFPLKLGVDRIDHG